MHSPTIALGLLSLVFFATESVASVTKIPRAAIKKVTSTYTGKKAGDGTFYGTSDAGGACLLPTRTDQRFAAFSGSAWDTAEWCGGCIRVTGPSVPRVVSFPSPTSRSTLSEPLSTSLEGSLDLATGAFEKISPLSAGRTSITWDWVDCKSVGLTTGTVSFAWKSGSSAYWMGIQPRGGSSAIQSVSIKQSSASSYTALTRMDYNYWVASSGAGAGTFRFLELTKSGEAHADPVVCLEFEKAPSLFWSNGRTVPRPRTLASNSTRSSATLELAS
ncbi:expansin, partial [Phenoliferia sp. Uapishka_3]